MLIRFSFFMSCFFVASFGLKAQKNHPAIIIEVTQNATLQNEKGKAQTVIPGAAFFPEATIHLGPQGKLVILENGQFNVIEGEPSYAIKDRSQSMQTSTRNFDPTFAEYIKSALSTVNAGINKRQIKIKNVKEMGSGWGAKDGGGGSGWGVKDGGGGSGWGAKDGGGGSGWGVNDPKSKSGWGAKDPGGANGWGVKDPQKTGGWGVKDPKTSSGWGAKDPKGIGGWGAKDGGGGSGWSAADMTVVVTTPGGVYAPQVRELSWLKDDDVYESLVCIFDQDLNIVDQKITVGNTVLIDFSQLMPDQSYYWQVFSGGKKAISPPVTFTVLSQDDYTFNLENAKDSHIYQKVNDATKGLMEAVSFEDINLYAEAQNKYQQLMSFYPDNSLIKMCYMAFCIRMGQENLAKEISKSLP